MSVDIKNNEVLNHLREKVEKVGTAMMSTATSQAHPSACPMHSLDFDDSGAIWFFTFADSEKFQDLSDSNVVNLIYAKPEDGIFVSLTGMAQLLADNKKAAQYWQHRFHAWIPDGPDSPGLYLIRVTVMRGESWDIETNRAIRFIKETKARMDGKIYEGGEHLSYASK